MELFVKRGQLSKPSFSVHAGHYTVLERVVQRLDHLPLVHRTGCSTFESIYHRGNRTADLRNVSPLLRSRHDNTPALQGGSRLVLGPAQALGTRHTVAQTSVFRGGFDLEAAESILKHGRMDRCSTNLRYLTRFVRRFFCNNIDWQMAHSIKLLESVRQYAAVQLHNTIASMQTRRRLVVHYAQFGDTDFWINWMICNNKSGDNSPKNWTTSSLPLSMRPDSLASKCCFAALETSAHERPLLRWELKSPIESCKWTTFPVRTANASG